MRRLRIAIAGGLCLAAAQACAQTSGTAPAPTHATYTGCVQKASGSDTTLILSTRNACARLTGKVFADDLAGRQVELKGTLTPRTASSAATIQVDEVLKVGNSCSGVCSLKPPGTRGLHKPDNAVPGSDGGTPGAVPTPPK